MVEDPVRERFVRETVALGEPRATRPLRQRLALVLVQSAATVITLGLMWWLWDDLAGRIVVTVFTALLVELPWLLYLIAPRRFVRLNARLGAPGNGPANPYRGMP